jgi:phytoene synthase
MALSRTPIQLDNESLEKGFSSARSAVRSLFKDSLFVTGNLPNDKRNELDAVGSHLVRCLDMLDLESMEGLSLDVWHEIRDELSDAFHGNFYSNDVVALEHVVTKYNIPKQFIFDMVNGADFWIRFREFKTYDELKTFTSNLGGSAMACAVPILETVEPDYEIPALKCGQAIMMTHLLANCVEDIKANKNFLPLEDLEKFDIEIHRLKMRQEIPKLKNFVRYYCSRIEKLFYEGGSLVHHLDYDGKRTVTSLLSVYWRMITNMRHDPDCILNPEGVLSKRDKLSLKSRHLLGMEGGIPIVPESDKHAAAH